MLKTVYPQVWGGLGNQMFVYAAARAHALRTGARLLLNVGALLDDDRYHRTYALDVFKLRSDVEPVRSARLRAAMRWRKELLPRCLFAYRKEREEEGVNPLPRHWFGRLWMTGYWQSEGYFADFAETIHSDFTFKDEERVRETPLARQIAACLDSAFIHLRSFHEAVGADNDERVLPVAYYENAIRHVISRAETRPTFFLFSDEPDFAERIVRPVVEKEGAELVVVRECGIDSPGADLMLMRLCRHAILGNSSFSWCGGWLGERDNAKLGRTGVVVCPEGVPFPGANRDFYPERWTRISRSAVGHSVYDAIVAEDDSSPSACQLRHRGLLAEEVPESARTVLVVKDYSKPVPDDEVRQWADKMRAAYQGKVVEFRVLQFAAAGWPDSELDYVKRIARPVLRYDTDFTSVEWSFLDGMKGLPQRLSGVDRVRYKLYRSLVKKLCKFGFGSMENMSE